MGASSQPATPPGEWATVTPCPDARGIALDHVLALAARGGRIFPVEARGKRPLVADWPNVATAHRETIRAWSRQYPSCHWGMACGPDSGVFIVDIDGAPGTAQSGRRILSKGWQKWVSIIRRCTPPRAPLLGG